MALLLNIDTATEQASVCLGMDANILAIEQAQGQKTHASFIQPAIQKVMQKTGYRLQNIDAVSVTGGPGSYTGLRVGLSTAKGLCYVLKKPLIMVNTLQIMAYACTQAQKQLGNVVTNVLFCPMIDARRMEVFTALYTDMLNQVLSPMAMVLDENAFCMQLLHKKIIFSGSGSHKAKIIQHPNAVFTELSYSAENLHMQSLMAYEASKFTDLAYSEPIYIKEFYKKA